MKIDEFSDLVFQLTNAAVELPADKHHQALVAILHNIFPFDAAWWGWSNFSGGRNHLINTGLFGMPHSFESAVRAVLHLDPFVQTGRNLTVFGKVIDVQTATLPEEYKACLQAFGIKSILNGHCRLQGDTEFNFFLSLYIREGDQKFTPTDGKDLRTILRHIEQNLSLSLKTELRNLAPFGGEAAFVSVGGSIVRATSGFQDQLFVAGVSPNDLCVLLQDMSFGPRQWRNGTLVLEGNEYKPGLVLVTVSRTDNLKGLSPQERRVCDLLMQGKTMREVAVENTVSHNTVRNQVAAIYRKLGVKNRAMLVHKVGYT